MHGSDLLLALHAAVRSHETRHENAQLSSSTARAALAPARSYILSWVTASLLGYTDTARRAAAARGADASHGADAALGAMDILA